jgi:KUP system potassium uptake protein
VKVNEVAPDCYQVMVHYGFKDEVDVPKALQACGAHGLVIETARSSYFLSRATVVPTLGAGMPLWREKLFATMAHNIGNVADYLKLPANRVIELGTRVEI